MPPAPALLLVVLCLGLPVLATFSSTVGGDNGVFAAYRAFFESRSAFATLTCAPWAWVLVAPSAHAPQGLVNVRIGETHAVAW